MVRVSKASSVSEHFPVTCAKQSLMF